MIVEEKKAGEHICPHLTEWRQKCEGSRCMAWRWRIDKVLVKSEDPDDVVKEYYTAQLSSTHGLCGLAGRS